MAYCKALFTITAITFAAVALLVDFFVPQLPNYIDSLPLKTRSGILDLSSNWLLFGISLYYKQFLHFQWKYIYIC